MKKLLVIIALCVLVTSLSISQSPRSFKYQAIARDVEGNIISNKQISLRINLLRGSNTGKIVYTEIHDLQTTDFGLILLEIGNGNSKSGDFSLIEWGSDNYYVSIDVDKNGGSDYITMGVSQLLSVPYALYAERSGSALTLWPGFVEPGSVSGSSSKGAGTWTDGLNEAWLTNPLFNIGAIPLTKPLIMEQFLAAGLRVSDHRMWQVTLFF